MRCDVLITQDPKTVFPDLENTDIEIWREGSSYSKALATSGPRDVAKYTFKNGNYPHLHNTLKIVPKSKKSCQKSDAPDAASNNGTSSTFYELKINLLIYFKMSAALVRTTKSSRTPVRTTCARTIWWTQHCPPPTIDSNESPSCRS